MSEIKSETAEWAQAVPLLERLRSVPANAVLKINTPNPLGFDTESIPVGVLCHEAAALLAADGWQPIETAPRGTDNQFLGCEDGLVDKTWEGWEEDGKPVYVHADWISWQPTLWMPLPEPPQ